METLASLPWDTLLELLGFSVGVVYLWWEYHADARLWIASVIMPGISMWIYLRRGIYADFAINIYYFLIAVYGYLRWTRRGAASDGAAGKAALPVTDIPPRQLLASAGVFALLWGALYATLRWLTDSTVPLADAFTTALSIVAMWMLARKYLQQWIAWIAVDAVCTGLYAYKGIYLYALLYAVYTFVAFKGYRNWRRIKLTQAAT